MEHTADILFDLFVIFALAKIAGEAFRRLGQPSVVGELLVGVAIGPVRARHHRRQLQR